MKARLVVPDDGPCAGHECDNCATCRRGRCCRRDNPDYKLPTLADWDAPVYGEIGVLHQDDTGLQCHACGEWYKHVGTHAWNTHNLTADEYRSIFGLKKTQALISADVFAKLSVLAKRNAHIGRAAIRLATEKWRSLTPEQRFARRSAPHRLQWHKQRASGEFKANSQEHSAEFIESICRLRRSGVRDKDIAQQMGLSQGVTSQVVRRSCPDARGHITRARRSDRKTIEAILPLICERRHAGEHLKSIGVAVGLSSDAVRALFARHCREAT